MPPDPRRWPSAYDLDDLKASIRAFAKGSPFKEGNYKVARRPGDNRPSDDFYMPTSSTSDLPAFCNGDVVKFDPPLRHGFVDAMGTLVESDAEYPYWLLTGNTCDMVRDIRDVPFTHMVPIDVVERAELDHAAISEFETYQSSRDFPLPPWEKAPPNKVFVADLTRPLSIHREGLANRGSVAARLSQTAWYLLHCCLIRYLARDDGRDAP